MKSAFYFKSRKPVPVSLDKDALLLRLDPAVLDPIGTIVVRELRR